MGDNRGVTIGDEARDPWGWLIALVLGGITWALLGGGVGVVAGAAVAAAVFGTKVVVGSALSGRKPRPAITRTTDALPLPAPDSEAAGYLIRAQQAQVRMAEIASRPGDPWLRSEVGRMDDGADDVAESLRDLGGRVALANQLLASADRGRLQADRQLLARRLEETTDESLATERQRALEAVDQQLAGLDRLESLREQLLARMQTATIGLENLATRMGEVVALGTAAMEHDRAGDLLATAGDELEALRTGLAEAQRLARGVG